VFARDRKGRPVYDASATGKDDQVRVFLRQCESLLRRVQLHPADLPQSLATIPRYWLPHPQQFLHPPSRAICTSILMSRGGIIPGGLYSRTESSPVSCASLVPAQRGTELRPIDYRHQEDENIASRGSITMKTAVLKVASGSNEQKFEVHHIPSRGHQTAQKWYLKADHPVEGTRWTTMIRKNIDWYKQEEQRDRAARKSETSLRAPSMKSVGTTNTSSNTLSSRRTLSKGREPSGNYSDNCNGGPDSEASSITGVGGDSPAVPTPTIVAGLERQEDGGDAPDGSSADDLTESDHPPFEDAFKIQENYVQIQTKLISDYLHALLKPGPPATGLTELAGQLKDNIGSINSTLDEYLEMVQKREAWWAARLQAEQKRQDVWEASLKTVVEEGEALERELKSRSSKRRSRMFSSENEEWRRSTLKSKPVSSPPSRMGTLSPPHLTAGEVFTLSSEPTSGTEAALQFKGLTAPVDLATEPLGTSTTPAASTLLTPSEMSVVNQPGSTTTVTAFTLSQSPSHMVRRFSLATGLKTPTLRHGSPEVDEVDTDEEDEEIDVFFDAIDAGTLPTIVSSALQVHEEKFLELGKAQYSGYINIRRRLDLDADNRPPTSLWSILKSSIGKGVSPGLVAASVR